MTFYIAGVTVSNRFPVFNNYSVNSTAAANQTKTIRLILLYLTFRVDVIYPVHF
jgi:hypothetical protein